MKKFSMFIWVCVMCFCALLAGCVDIWEGMEGDECLYEINEMFSGNTNLLYYKKDQFYNTEFSFYNIKLKRDNTVELRRYYDDDEQTVSSFGNEYAGYNAQYKDCNVIYGTYKQMGDRLKITFVQYAEYDKMEVSGEDAEAFKCAYVKINPNEAEIFDKGIVQNDDHITKKLTLLVSDNECKPLNFEVEDTGIKETWTYYSSGQIKSYNYADIDELPLQLIANFNADGSYKESDYFDGIMCVYGEYNSDRNCTFYRTCDFDGKLASEMTKEYDSNGSCISEREYDSDGNLMYEYTHEYNSNGSCIFETRYDSDGKMIKRWTSEYDLNDNCIASKEYGSDGKLKREETWEYDSTGNCIAGKEYGSDGKLEREGTWEYDSNGNCIATRYYSLDGFYFTDDILRNEYTREYDSNGNCISYRVYDFDGKLRNEEIKEYDSTGKLVAIVEREYDSDGKLISEKTWEYDSNGNCTAKREYGSSGKLVNETRYGS